MKRIKIALIIMILIGIIPISAKAAMMPPQKYSHNYSLMVGEDVKLEFDEVGTVKWTSKNKKIATVSKKGIVKAIGKGETIITAKVNGKIVEYDISVSKVNDAFITKTLTSKGDTVDKAVYITKSKYNSLSNGYSYDDAIKIIGVNGSLISSDNDETNKTKTEVYSWVGEDGVANATVIFVNGKITEKDEMFLD